MPNSRLKVRLKLDGSAKHRLVAISLIGWVFEVSHSMEKLSERRRRWM
jgi:hypothetical protein